MQSLKNNQSEEVNNTCTITVQESLLFLTYIRYSFHHSSHNPIYGVKLLMLAQTIAKDVEEIITMNFEEKNNKNESLPF